MNVALHASSRSSDARLTSLSVSRGTRLSPSLWRNEAPPRGCQFMGTFASFSPFNSDRLGFEGYTRPSLVRTSHHALGSLDSMSGWHRDKTTLLLTFSSPTLCRLGVLLDFQNTAKFALTILQSESLVYTTSSPSCQHPGVDLHLHLTPGITLKPQKDPR